MVKDIVLCVDDEPIVLQSLKIVVAMAGFRVVAAENATEGLEIFMRLKDEIALVLADIKMPVVSGIEMAERIMEHDPHAKILLMSGYGDSVIDRESSRFPFIRKPYINAVLIEKIRSLTAASDATTSGV